MSLERIKRNWKVYGIVAAILYAAYAMFLNPTFTSDGVVTTPENLNSLFPLAGTFTGGRFMLFYIQYIYHFLDKFHISKYENQYIFEIIVMLVVALVITRLYVSVEHYFETRLQKAMALVIIMIGFVNPLYVETFVYCGLELAIAALFMCFAVELFDKEKYIASAILVFLGISTYQSYIALFMIYASTILFFRHEGRLSKRIVIEYIRMFLVGGIPALLSIGGIQLYVAILNKSAFVRGFLTASVEPVAAATKEVSFTSGIAERLHNMIYAYAVSAGKCFGMMPTLFIFIIMMIMCVATIAVLIVRKASVWDIVFYIVHFILLNFYSVAIFGVSTVTTPAPRICWHIFTTLSMVMLSMLWLYLSDSAVRWQMVILVIFLLVDVYYMLTCELDFFMGNAIDKQIVYQVEAEIDHYEKETGNKVTKIATYHGEDGQFYYEQQILNPYFEYTYNHKTLHYNWSDVELIRAVTGKVYEQVDMDYSIEKNYFEGKKWDTFIADEQLIFDGDTLYWAIY